MVKIIFTSNSMATLRTVDSAGKFVYLNNNDDVAFVDTSTPDIKSGTGKLVNGKAHILIDPIFAKNIVVNEKHPIKVFIQLEGDCKGVYVANKSQNGFDVIELAVAVRVPVETVEGMTGILLLHFCHTGNHGCLVNGVRGVLLSAGLIDGDGQLPEVHGII
jgi:hypothetical protein